MLCFFMSFCHCDRTINKKRLDTEQNKIYNIFVNTWLYATVRCGRTEIKMKKTVKRIISLGMSALLIAGTLAFVGCGGDSEMTCEVCKQTKNSQTYTVTVDGVEMKACSDCKKVNNTITRPAESVEATDSAEAVTA